MTPARGAHPAPKLVIDLEKMAQLPREQSGPLARYVATIQSQRGDYNGRVLSIRQEASVRSPSSMTRRPRT